MQLGAEIDEPFRPANECREQIGCKGVDGEDMRKSIRRESTLPFPVADSCIVDDGVELSEFVHLIGDAAGRGNAAEVAGDDGFRTGRGSPGNLGPLRIAGV